MDSAVSSKAFVRDQRVFQQGSLIENQQLEDDEHTTSYYGGEVYTANGLYVVPPPGSSAINDNYGYLPSPPPVPAPPTTRYLYPENAGHLV